MKEKITRTIFSLNGASILIGVIGFTSSIVTLFIDINGQLSIKWFIFVVVLLVSLILILLKVIYDLSCETKSPQPFEIPIKYIPDEQILVIKRNENFTHSIVVGCYRQDDGIDRLAYLGVVHLVQDKVIQIKITIDYQIIKQIPTTIEELKNIIIRPVIPITALKQFNDME